MSTEELIAGCIKKNHMAWNEFIRRYHGVVQRSVYFKLNRLNAGIMLSEAPDIMQEIFLTIWSKNSISGIRDITRLKRWLVMVSIHGTLNYCRKRFKEMREEKSLSSRLSFSPQSFTLESTLLCEKFNPVRIFEVREMKTVLDKEMGKLRNKEKRVLELNILGGKKQVEIAKTMKIPPNTVATLIRRAKKKVRDGVLECGYHIL